MSLSPPTDEAPPRLKSVRDYSCDDELLSALSGGRLVAKRMKVEEVVLDESLPDVEWTLDSLDSETTETPTLANEFRRLQVLNSYFVLDEEREDALDRLTGIATKTFNVPIAVVSLVDLGRLYFVSSKGLGDVRAMPRKNAFCSHAIMNKKNFLVVKDAANDTRFCGHPIVCGPANIRFYAAAALQTPEGYTLGTFCLLDTRERFKFTRDDERYLEDFANMAVQVMVDRRFRIQMREREDNRIASAAHDLLTPLTGLQLSLTLLKEDTELQKRLDPDQQRVMDTVLNCSDMMGRICHNAVEGLRSGQKSTWGFQAAQHTKDSATCRVSDLVVCLREIMNPIPKRVPMVFSLDPSVPEEIVCEELKVFRAALNLLSTACDRTEYGSVSLRIFSDDRENLTFECHDTAQEIDPQDVRQALNADDASEVINVALTGLHFTASTVKSMRGTCGVRSRSELGKQGSVFWFKFPVILPPGCSWSDENALYTTIEPKSTAAGHIPMFSYSEFPGNAMSAPLHSSLPRAPPPPVSQIRVELSPTPAVAKTLLSVKMINETDSPVPLTRQKKALIVDDSLVVRKSIARALSKLGYEVLLANDGMQGLEELKKDLFDVCLMDFLMPVMDGLDCVKQYRDWEADNRPWFRQYIVGISAHANDCDAEKGLAVGMDLFQSKPFTVQTLNQLHLSGAVIRMQKQLDNLVMESEGTGMDDGVSEISMSNHSMGSGPVATKALATRGLLQGSDVTGMTEAMSVLQKFGRSPASTVSNSQKCCLVATSDPDAVPNAVSLLQSGGWRCEVVHSSFDAMRLLRSRNWDAVLVDDCLQPQSGAECIASFRQWERSNRVNRQNNVILGCTDGFDCPTYQDGATSVQAPDGFDGALSFPMQLQDFSKITREGDGYMSIISR